VLLLIFYQKTDEKVGVNVSVVLNGPGGWLHEAISDNAEKES